MDPCQEQLGLLPRSGGTHIDKVPDFWAIYVQGDNKAFTRPYSERYERRLAFLSAIATVAQAYPRRFIANLISNLPTLATAFPNLVRKLYDETIRMLKTAVQNGKLGQQEELNALERLNNQSRQLEGYASGPDLKEIVAGEFRQSAALDGRSVVGWERVR